MEPVPKPIRPIEMLLAPRPAAWQLLYRDADANVDVRITANADGTTVDMAGQAQVLVGAPSAGGAVEIRPSGAGAGAPLIAATFDGKGEFGIARIPRGRYDVMFLLGERRVTLPDVEL